MKFNIEKVLVLIICLFATVIIAQDEKPQDWHHLPTSSDIKGVSTDAAYELVKGKKSTEIIVAVLDSGIDLQHEDLQGVLWTNKGEIAGNNKDDDGNGYIDDVNGWSFLGNPSGENLNSTTLEATRIYSAGDKFPGSKSVYAAAAKDFAENRGKAVANVMIGNDRIATIDHIAASYPEATVENVKEYKSTCAASTSHCDKIIGYMERGKSLADYKSAMTRFTEYYQTQKDY